MLGQARGKPEPANGRAISATAERLRFRVQMWIVSISVIATSVTLASIIPQQASPTVLPFEDIDTSVEFFGDMFRATLPNELLKDTSPATSLLAAAADVRTSASDLRAGSSVRRQMPIRTNWGSELRGLVHDAAVAPLLPPRSVSSSLILGTPPGNFETRLAYRAGTIEQSLVDDGRRAGLSDPLIMRLVEIFGWDIDFALDIEHGDRFVVIYEEKLWFGRKIGEGDILAAEFTNRGRVHRAIGFRDASGRVSYFTPTGKSLQRPFLRTPVQFGNISSQFSAARYHPILKTWRAHKGVDYAAPVGTPVRATAAGRLLSVGWNGGYGNTVAIEHGGAYSTLYAHLSRYRPGLKPGQRITQGEVIGYVGQTGLATGPHLHYELQVHGQHQDPLTFAFPDGEPVSIDLREDFLRTARTWIARLEFVANRHLAIAAR